MNETLSCVLQALASAPEGVKTGHLRDFCNDNGLEDEDIDECLESGCTDVGRVNFALGGSERRKELKKSKKKAKK